MTGAPVLAIFAAGSLTAILAFACPLSHLIKLLNVSSLIKIVLNSCKLVYIRYKPEVLYADLQVCPTTTIKYSKLNQNGGRSTSRHHQLTWRERFKGLFVKTPQYIHRLSSPKGPVCNIRKVPRGKKRSEEHECLLFDDYNSKSVNVDIPEESNSENEENEMEIMSCSDAENSDSSTDIDVIVEEYREGLRVATVGKFNEKKPSSKTTSVLVIMCLLLIIISSINITLYIFHIIRFYWPDILTIFGCVLIITGLPENASEKSKPCLLPSLLFPLAHSLSIAMNTILATLIIVTVWQGVVFWTISGLLLYWRCDCCQCEILEPLVSRTTAKVDTQHVIYEYKENLMDSIVITR